MVVFLYLMELVKAKVPMSYWCLSLDSLKGIDDAYKQIVLFYLGRLEKAIRKSMGLIFFGTNGIGKTSLMCEIGKEAIVRGYVVQYFTVQQYVDAVKGDSPIVREFQDADMILLDEMDKVYIKKGSSYVGKSLEDFLRRSISSGRAVIAGTNFDEETFTNTFGDSTVSMLKRHSKFLEVEGEDYSDTLYNSWEDMLDEDYDFYCDSIVKMATRLHEFVEERENEAWR